MNNILFRGLCFYNAYNMQNKEIITDLHEIKFCYKSLVFNSWEYVDIIRKYYDKKQIIQTIINVIEFDHVSQIQKKIKNLPDDNIAMLNDQIATILCEIMKKLQKKTICHALITTEYESYFQKFDEWKLKHCKMIVKNNDKISKKYHLIIQKVINSINVNIEKIISEDIENGSNLYKNIDTMDIIDNENNDIEISDKIQIVTNKLLHGAASIESSNQLILGKSKIIEMPHQNTFENYDIYYVRSAIKLIEKCICNYLDNNINDTNTEINCLCCYTYNDEDEEDNGNDTKTIFHCISCNSNMHIECLNVNFSFYNLNKHQYITCGVCSVCNQIDMITFHESKDDAIADLDVLQESYSVYRQLNKLIY